MKRKLIILLFAILLVNLKTEIYGQINETISLNQIIKDTINNKTITESKSTFVSMKENTTFIKDIVYIVFLIIGIIITILTYNRAKDTILQPLKTEVIKKQITIFSDLIVFLEDRNNFNFGNIIQLNVTNFISSFENYKSIMSNSLHQHAGSFGIDISNRDIKNKDIVDGDLLIVPKMKFENSGRYVVSEILLDSNDINMQTNLLNLVKNPLIPKIIKNKIEKVFNDYRESLRNILPNILEEQLNLIYNHIQNNQDITFEYISQRTMIINNTYNQKRIKHEVSIEELKQEMNNYLKIENLF